MKNIARHALAVMALIAAALGQQQGDSLSASIEKAQALDREARQVCRIGDAAVQVNWEYAKKQARSAEQYEMKPVEVLNLIPINVMYVRGAIVADLADCAFLRNEQKIVLKLQSALWDLSDQEHRLLRKRIENRLLMDDIQAKQKEH
jgi:hypothetical protein